MKTGEELYDELRRMSLADVADVLHQVGRTLRIRGVKDAPWQINAAALSIVRRREALREAR